MHYADQVGKKRRRKKNPLKAVCKTNMARQCSVVLCTQYCPTPISKKKKKYVVHKDTR